jgi:hypothetical protein
MKLDLADLQTHTVSPEQMQKWLVAHGWQHDTAKKAHHGRFRLWFHPDHPEDRRRAVSQPLTTELPHYDCHVLELIEDVARASRAAFDSVQVWREMRGDLVIVIEGGRALDAQARRWSVLRALDDVPPA